MQPEPLPLKRRGTLYAAVLLTLAAPALADNLPEYQLVLKDHVYRPSELKVRAGTKFKITVRNEDATAEEFESTDFNREKIVPPNSTVTVYVGPLSPGSYGFFGDFHQDTAKGRLIAE
jgi:plastocyanin